LNIRDAYTAWSSIYDLDRNLTRDLDHVVTRQVIGEQRYQTALEMGCGTGKNTALLALVSERLISFDFSSGMLAQARAKPALAAVHFALADLTASWPVAAACADLVTFNLVLEHIPDLQAVFREAYRVLGWGGQLFLCELHPFKQYQGKQARFEQHGIEVTVTAYLHHLSDYLQAAKSAGLSLARLDEWWVDADHSVPPRLVSMVFNKCFFI
jgi:malonyl-CoA O-methyltransferase